MYAQLAIKIKPSETSSLRAHIKKRTIMYRWLGTTEWMIVHIRNQYDLFQVYLLFGHCLKFHSCDVQVMNKYYHYVHDDLVNQILRHDPGAASNFSLSSSRSIQQLNAQLFKLHRLVFDDKVLQLNRIVKCEFEKLHKRLDQQSVSHRTYSQVDRSKLAKNYKSMLLRSERSHLTCIPSRYNDTWMDYLDFAELLFRKTADTWHEKPDPEFFGFEYRKR